MRRLRSVLSREFRLLAWAPSGGAGRSLRRDRQRRGSHRYARAWLPGGRPGRELAVALSCPVGRGVWESRAGRRRAHCAGRGAGCSGQNWGAFLRGGAVSAKRRADAPTVDSGKSESRKSKIFFFCLIEPRDIRTLRRQVVRAQQVNCPQPVALRPLPSPPVYSRGPRGHRARGHW